MFADNGLPDGYETKLYFPADPAQMVAVIKRVFFEKGMRFVFSTRSKVPWILKEDGSRFFDENYEFVPGKDETILEGKAGYVVAYGDMLYRAYDAVLRCRQEGLDVGLVIKSTLNIIDEQALTAVGKTPFVLVVESANQKTGLGSKYGTWLLERGLTPKYGYMGTTKEGSGGLWEQVYHQGLDPQCEWCSLRVVDWQLMGPSCSDHPKDQGAQPGAVAQPGRHAHAPLSGNAQPRGDAPWRSDPPLRASCEKRENVNMYTTIACNNV